MPLGMDQMSSGMYQIEFKFNVLYVQPSCNRSTPSAFTQFEVNTEAWVVLMINDRRSCWFKGCDNVAKGGQPESSHGPWTMRYFTKCQSGFHQTPPAGSSSSLGPTIQIIFDMIWTSIWHHFPSNSTGSVQHYWCDRITFIWYSSMFTEYPR